MAAKRKAARKAAAPKPRALCPVKLAAAEALSQKAATERHGGTALEHRVAALELRLAALIEAR